ncbi:MAG: hypothetical protein HKN47_16375 [Pirellulaceae bacterium]|nr:hypothetical protein [Pirellulaceae bacterium]
MPLFDAIRQDYVQNSSDTIEIRQRILHIYDAVIFDVLMGNQIDVDALNEFALAFQHGHRDPIILLTLLNYDHLNSQLKDDYQRSMYQSLMNRHCSDVTKFIAIAALADHKGNVRPDDLARLTTMMIDAAPKVWTSYGHDKNQRQFLSASSWNMSRVMNGPGFIDFVCTLLRADDTGCPPSMKPVIAAAVYESIGSHVRGRGYVSQIHPGNMEFFRQASSRAALHLVQAWEMDPELPLIPRELMQLETRAGCTPLTSQQWYRISLTSLGDSHATTALMTQSLLPRWGGSIEKLNWYCRELIRYATANPKHRILFTEPIRKWMRERSSTVRIDEASGFADEIIEFLDSLERANPGHADRRVSRRDAALIYRILWDGGRLDELSGFSHRYKNVIFPKRLYEARVPVHLCQPFLVARMSSDQETKNAWDVVCRNLLAGDEKLNLESLEQVTQAVAKVLNSTAIDPTTSGKFSDRRNGRRRYDEAVSVAMIADLMETIKILHRHAVAFHQGKTVDLITDSAAGWNHFGYVDNNLSNVIYRDDSIQIKASEKLKDLVFTYPLRFKEPYTVELDVRCNSQQRDPYGVALFAGPVGLSYSGGPTIGRSLRFVPGTRSVTQDRLPSERLGGGDFVKQTLTSVPRQATLKMEVSYFETRSFVNDHLVGETLYPINTLGHIQFGRNAGRKFPASNRRADYTITSLRVTKADD